MTSEETQPISRREKLDALLAAARFNPKFTALLVIFGAGVAVLEAVGLTFIVPIIEIVQASDPVAEASGLTAVFVRVYQTLGIPFTLGFVVAGVAGVMIMRYTSSFIYHWFRFILKFNYQRALQDRAFKNALQTRMNYFDEEGSDEILNTIITESASATNVVNKIVKILNVSFLSLAYLLIALWISPFLTLISLIILASITILLRNVVESGYDLGDVVADANEKRHQTAQAGMIGIRDIRVFNLHTEIYQRFQDAIDDYTRAKIRQKRNQSLINNFYSLTVAVFVFVLIYIALQFANLSFGEFGLFLFVMFQLGPRMSSLNELVYAVENELPHLVRTQQFVNEIERRKEPSGGTQSVPNSVEHIEFDDVTFSYNGEETVVDGITFDVEKGEFVAFVGQSGAGKSTIVSLLARFYEPDRGRIYANEKPIDEMDAAEWREHIAVVRQSPYIFNDTLRHNLTIGNRDATQREIERASRIARVDEFLDDLPNGFDSELGDEGVRLSGGQKQRVSLARALLKDADLLVLDEATSDLDSNLEQQVQAAIERMDRDYAMITIAHRLSTVQNADRIYTIRDGRIIEKGDHQDLLESNGEYAELYALQSG
jgi:subfamily B ATP-binding cassette protein MsbA